MKTVCFFGIYDPEYSRNQVLAQGFRDNGWEVAHARVDPKKHSGILKYTELAKKWKEFKNDKVDLILVAFPGHSVVWLARLLWPRHRIYFDAFLSRYDSNVEDRRAYGKSSLRAWADWLLDWSSCMLAHKILLDTNEHIEYFSRQFGVKKKKMIRVPIGAHTAIFYPRESQRTSQEFIVHFHGMFIPLQGIKYILEAAELLSISPDVIFNIIGAGQDFGRIAKSVQEKKISNVRLLGKKESNQVAAYIAEADVCLGIFGDTDKASRVVPNKVYEYIAMKKAVITADTPAMKEFFSNGEHMILCERSSGKSIAEAIQKFKSNPAQRRELAENSYEYFTKNLSPHRIVSDLIKSIGI